VRKLRAIYADAPEISKTALENVIHAVQSGKPAPEAVPMKSAGRIGADRGKVSELTTLRRWRQLAATRYDELIAAHPEAFADHAAEYWLPAGADPMKALRLAQINFEVRQTPRARDLVGQAVAAAHSGGAL